MKRNILDAFGLATLVGFVTAVVYEVIGRYENWRWQRDEHRLTGGHR